MIDGQALDAISEQICWIGPVIAVLALGGADAADAARRLLHQDASIRQVGISVQGALVDVVGAGVDAGVRVGEMVAAGRLVRISNQAASA
ncbi:hypothetical protein CLG96_11645 [Sphingomonas oleivorans]|uniref:Uncharacterized protein n=1 Tax=Sphingomonas oleivorans TaxID=1735121 RepID=A0A2T5FVM4_9SPHN|nr:hypothetical protein [Sphingomonas oleivorans]PTQ09823.1 hypothetical protein CLG96_11645 [Sphingomonas oleivorans]